MPKQPAWSSDKKDGARSRHRHRTTISWESAPSETTRTFIARLTEMGCAVMFGRTTDGGALSLLVLAGNDKYREYITSVEDIMPTFLDLCEDLGIGETSLSST